MLKRKIGVVVAGMLLAAQVGLAVAGESAIPLGDQAIVAKGEPPVQSTYQAQNAGSAIALRGDADPADAEAIVAKGEPSVQTTFQAQNADSVTAALGNAVPAGAQAIVARGEPPVRVM